MKTIERSTPFKRDYKRIRSTPRHAKDLDGLLVRVLDLLANSQPLPPGLRDHTLSGNWAGYRECHLKPDLLLIYSLPDETTLRLVRLGSHSDLF